MITNPNANHRLWVQVTPRLTPSAAPSATIVAGIITDLVASGVGAVIKTASDRLIAPDQYSTSTILAYEPAFALRSRATTPEFLLKCITLNVGPKPLRILDDKMNPIPGLEMENYEEYKESPVVAQIEFLESIDGTAITGKVAQWKYEKFLDPSSTWFRTPRRKVTIEIKVSAADGTSLLALAMQVEATESEIRTAKPNEGERLPWSTRPSKSAQAPGDPNTDIIYGPVNIEAKITEVAEPSAFAKVLGSTLSNQKATVETYIKGRVAQAFDESAAAQAQLTLISAAASTREKYETAHSEAVAAKKAFSQAHPPGENERQQLILKLQVLKQQEVLARGAFDKAGLPFYALPEVPGP
ncbi:hypothetical protein [Microvirga sp. VF16]|uniref:hypothetical protein n=1 Tax=Microvirga sp. VF16 TaxID=2807101 RepID=UPI00193D0E34|nr:hypothetical protein [Microvirga sp. VF16]QRM35411.1 hypothetical protein JO965_44455 [Microvirga sp. VF16]